MKLSEAIRLGSMLAPQGFGPICERIGDGTLSLQSAHRAIGLNDAGGNYDPQGMEDAFPILLYPVWLEGNTFLGSAIVTLNDDNRWTREQIADWVETIERQQEAKAQQPQELTA